MNSSSDDRFRKTRRIRRGTEATRVYMRRFVGDVVAEFVLGCVVPFFFLDHFEAAALLRIGRIEYVGKKFDAFAQAFDDAEALVIHARSIS